MPLNRLCLPRLAAGLLLVGALTSAAPAAAQITYLGNSTPTPSGVLSTLAYDDKHNVYLQVYEWNRGVWGRFIGADGAILGQPFVIATTLQSFAGKPKVTYSSGNAVDRFLVTYVSDANVYDVGSNIFGQLVAYTGAAPYGGTLVGPSIPVSPMSGNGSRRQNTSDIVYNPLSSQFLVVYDEFFSEGWDVMARHFDVNGTPTSDPANVSNVPYSQGAAVAAFDWQRGRYLVAFMGDHPSAPAGGVFAQLLDGTTLQPLSGTIILGFGYSIELSVTYMPEADAFLPLWMYFGPSGDRDIAGRAVPSLYAGTIGAPYGVLATPGLNEGASQLEYDWVSRKILAAGMRDPYFIGGAVLNAQGVPETGAFGMSTPVPAFGSFFPSLRAAASGIFGASYNTDYALMQFERFQLPAAATPGPKCCGAIPAPQGVIVQIDLPGSNQTITPPFNIKGWAIDQRSTSGPGIDVLHAWAVPTNGGAATFVGILPVGDYRPDVGQFHGPQFTNSGFGVMLSNIAPGNYTLVLYPHSTVTGAFDYDKTKTLNITIAGGALTQIDAPVWGQTFGGNGVGMHISGWAIDLANPSFDGIDTVHIWAINALSGAATFLGVPGPEIRIDVAQAYGNRFWESGYRLVNTVPLPAGTYYLVVYSHSYGAGPFNVGRVVGVHIQ